MYVCICKAVTEEKLQEQAKNRKKCAKDVCKSLGVGMDCGVCIQKALNLLESSMGNKQSVHQTKKS